MTSEARINELVQQCLVDNRSFDGVRFVDELLNVADEVGQIACTLANEHELRFEIPNRPAWQIELTRAKAKLRMLCARLSVLCNETAGQDVSIYGGAGIIERAHASSPDSHTRRQPELAGLKGVQAPNNSEGAGLWKVSFKNTPGEQEFTIST